MKSSGIIRKVDELGRVVIPKEIRTSKDIQDEDPMEIYVEGDKIILMKHHVTCIFCGSADELAEFKGKKICKTCLNEIKL